VRLTSHIHSGTSPSSADGASGDVPPRCSVAAPCAPTASRAASPLRGATMSETTFAPLSEDETRRLDAAEDALLAPVRGSDARRRLDKPYFKKRPGRFTAKLLF